MTQMLYKHPGPHKIHGNNFDYIVVDADKVTEMQKAGWSETTEEAIIKAKTAAEPAKARRSSKPKAAPQGE